MNRRVAVRVRDGRRERERRGQGDGGGGRQRDSRRDIRPACRDARHRNGVLARQKRIGAAQLEDVRADDGQRDRGRKTVSAEERRPFAARRRGDEPPSVLSRLGHGDGGGVTNDTPFKTRRISLRREVVACVHGRTSPVQAFDLFVIERAGKYRHLVDRRIVRVWRRLVASADADRSITPSHVVDCILDVTIAGSPLAEGRGQLLAVYVDVEVRELVRAVHLECLHERDV